jgi:hypothetical protein
MNKTMNIPKRIWIYDRIAFSMPNDHYIYLKTVKDSNSMAEQGL